ncbi:hypothetical protein [Sneathiella limimaris]|uniref:hypothetical protein n=1 Tax=Sneathiella limimaris TaxID=1964213 RepID=UPI00146D53BF|nr:hypothetical protein [Sneathiella limimaris]
MDPAIKDMVEECYFETVLEALNAGHSNLVAHKEGVTGAAMLLSSLNNMEDEEAKSAVVALNLRPAQLSEK